MSRVIIVLAALCAIASGAQIRKFKLNERNRIAGGQDADIKDFPYQVSLETYGWHMCSASIISEYWALSAAHCVYVNFRAGVEGSVVRAGSSTVGDGGSVHQVAEFIWHPKYSYASDDYDYGLIRVETPFPLGKQGVSAIKLSEYEPKDGQLALISGWGALSSGGPEPTQLQKVEIPIIGRDTCKEIYKGYEHITDITERMFCAGLRAGGKDSCERDSGGPLVVDGVLTGIVSWGIGCAYPDKPGVYSNVADQRDWIREITAV